MHCLIFGMPFFFYFILYEINCYILCDNSQREPEEPEDATKGRDVFNEKPPADELLAASDIGKSITTSLPDNVVSFSFLGCLYNACMSTFRHVLLYQGNSFDYFVLLI